LKEKLYQRKCPNPKNNSKCNKIIYYKNKKSYCRAIKNNATCLKCNHIKYFIESNKRICPKCKKEIKYKSKFSYLTALKNNRKCKSCSKSGENNSNYKSGLYTTSKKIYEKICINPLNNSDCLKVMKYRSYKAYKNSIKNNRLCLSCASIKIIRKEKYERICSNPLNNPKCHHIIYYKNKGSYVNAIKNDSICQSCVKFGYVTPIETRNKIKFKQIGKVRNEESIEKQRISIIEKKIKNNNFSWPSYSIIACEIIDWFNMYYDLNFRHALNGGEIRVGRYFPDGIDEERKLIIEVDERHHFDNNGNLKQNDIKRQKNLENLGYEFIRVKLC